MSEFHQRRDQVLRAIEILTTLQDYSTPDLQNLPL
jgi:hypothetical protein